MKTLRLRPLPEPSESFSSWVHRVALINAQTLEHFVKAIREQYASVLKGRFYVSNSQLHKISPDAVEHEQLVVLMSHATGLSEPTVDNLTLNSYRHRYFRKYLVPSGRVGRPPKGEVTKVNQVWHADAYCPECLADGFFLRRLWRPGYPGVCTLHERTLLDECPGCHACLDFYERRVLPQHHQQGGSRLPCWRCKLDLAQATRHRIAPQHMRLTKFLCDLLEGEFPVVSFDPYAKYLDVVHWWMEAFFQTCTSLPYSPLFWHKENNRKPQYSDYSYMSCRVRYALFEAACKAIGQVGQRYKPPKTSEDTSCRNWLGRTRWRSFVIKAESLVEMFPELLDQSSIEVPDRSILLPP